jgi:hypothetical protein
MIIGAHSILYSNNPDGDRAFLKDMLHLPNVDVGGGWLIFGLPPAEVAVHPSDKNDVHELYLMCDDIETFIAHMKEHGIICGPIQDQGWGLLTQLTLPGGGKLGVYEPRHARPEQQIPAKATKKPVRTAAKRAAKKTPVPASKRAAKKTPRTAAKRAAKNSAKKNGKKASNKKTRK